MVQTICEPAPLQEPFQSEDLSWGGASMDPPPPPSEHPCDPDPPSVQTAAVPPDSVDLSDDPPLEGRLRAASQSAARLASAQAAMTDDQIVSLMQQIETRRLGAMLQPAAAAGSGRGRASDLACQPGAGAGVGGPLAPRDDFDREALHRAAAAMSAALSSEGKLHGDLLSRWASWRDTLIDGDAGATIRGAPPAFNPGRLEAWIADRRASVSLATRRGRHECSPKSPIPFSHHCLTRLSRPLLSSFLTHRLGSVSSEPSADAISHHATQASHLLGAPSAARRPASRLWGPPPPPQHMALLRHKLVEQLGGNPGKQLVRLLLSEVLDSGWRELKER